MSAEVIYPFAFWQVDAVADIVALLVHLGLLVDRSHEEGWTAHKLILCSLAQGIRVGVVEEHRSYQRFAGHGLVGSGVDVRHQLRLEFQIPAVHGSCRFAQDMRILGISAPAIHVQSHCGEGLPFKLAHVHYRILSAEDTIVIGGDVGDSRKSGTDEGRDVEADVLPVATGLVARPDGCIALCAGPAIKRDDERTGILAIVRHNLSHVRYTIQSERIAVAYPGHIGLEYSYACMSHLLHDITLQKRLDALLWVQVRLCPESDFHTVLAGVISKLLQVLDVSVQGAVLAISGSISVVRQEPAQWHVVLDVSVDGRTSRELVVVLLAVQ